MPGHFENRAGSPPPDWDDSLNRARGSIFHSSIWAGYQRAIGAGVPIYLFERDAAGAITIGSLAFYLQSPRPIASFLFRRLSLPSHPFASPGAEDRMSPFLTTCEQFARGLGCSHLAVSSFMSGDSPWIPESLGYAETQRLEFTLDLRQERDVLWKGIAKDQRERIRKLDREGVRVEEGTALEHLLELRHVREATQEKRADRGQGYVLEANPRFYAALHEHLLTRRAARLFLARRGEEVLAGLLFAAFGGRCYSLFSGSTDAGYRCGAQSSIFWHAVEAFQGEGFSELNRGGVPASAREEGDSLHGIYRFKLRLGTTERLCRSGLKVVSPARARLLAWREGLRRVVAGVRRDS